MSAPTIARDIDTQMRAEQIRATVTPEIERSLACPHWCTQPAGHDLDDATLVDCGGVWRTHLSDERVVVEHPQAGGSRPVTVRLHQWAGWTPDYGELQVTPVRVEIDGEPGDSFSSLSLTVGEAVRLAVRIGELYRLAGGAW